MKKLLLFMLPALFLVACNKGPNEELEALKGENERLRAESYVKDSTLNSVFASYNEIEENLAIIKEKEQLIRKAGDSELNPDSKHQIAEDLTLISELMEQNRQTIANLRRRINSSEIKMEEFQKTIDLLNQTLEEKDAEIAKLTAELATKDVELKNLTAQIKNISSDLKSSEQTISMQESELNRAFCIVGTERELREKGVIDRQGGFVGVGKIRTLSKDFDVNRFTEVDIRKFKTINVNAKSAKIITSHPTNSYNMVGTKTVEKIEIIDAASFWKNSRYLVVIVK